VLGHGAHRRQLGRAHFWRSRLPRLHDVGEVDPLIAATVTVLRRVGLAAGYLTDSTHALVIVRPHKHRGLPVTRARRLRAGEPTLIEQRASTCAAWLRVADAGRLNEMDLAAVRIRS